MYLKFIDSKKRAVVQSRNAIADRVAAIERMQQNISYVQEGLSWKEAEFERRDETLDQQIASVQRDLERDKESRKLFEASIRNFDTEIEKRKVLI